MMSSVKKKCMLLKKVDARHVSMSLQYNTFKVSINPEVFLATIFSSETVKASPLK